MVHDEQVGEKVDRRRGDREERLRVPHDQLPDPVGLVGLQDPDRAVDDRDRGHDAHQGEEQAEPRPARDEQGLVEHHLDQQRVDDADRRGHHDESDDHRHLGPVRPEQRQHPPRGIPPPVRRRVRGFQRGRGQRPRGVIRPA